jgi:transcriptional regulator with XRE-family HTH domain
MSVAMKDTNQTSWLIAARLKRARQAAGFQTAASFAREKGINETSYQHHENGTRRLTPETAKAYGALLNLPPSALLYGEHLPEEVGIPIVGFVSSHGTIFHFTDSTPQTLVGPFDAHRGYVAYRILGNDLHPAYRDGDHILCRPLGRRQYRLFEISGHDCVVKIADGSILLRQVIAQSETTAALVAYAGPPLEQQTVVEITLVEQIIRALPAHLRD